MKFNRPVHVRLAVTALAATVALGAVTSPALAEVRVGVGPTVHDSEAHGDRLAGVERGADQFRGRYQLQLSRAPKLLGA